MARVPSELQRPLQATRTRNGHYAVLYPGVQLWRTWVGLKRIVGWTVLVVALLGLGFLGGVVLLR